MKTHVINLILRVIAEQNDTFAHPIDLSAESQAALFGGKGHLDSLELVRLTIDIEAAVASEFGAALVLTSENAMSRSRSPFLSVDTLADHVCTLLEDSGITSH